MKPAVKIQVRAARRSGAWYFFLLASASLMWSGQGTAIKFLDRQLGPIAITFLPFYVATVLLFPALVVRWRRKRFPGWTDWMQFVVAGIGGQILAQLGMTWGISKSLASNGAILNLLIPVITAMMASLLLSERITALRAAALGIGLIGVLFLSVEDLRSSSFFEPKYLAGNLLILAGCSGSSFYNVYCKGLMRRYDEIDILIFSYLTASAASVPLLVWAEPFDFGALARLDGRSWMAFAFLALFVYGISMLLFFAALRHLPVTTASVCVYLVPAFGVLAAALLLKERLSGLALVGAGTVLAATVLIMRYDTPQSD